MTRIKLVLKQHRGFVEALPLLVLRRENDVGAGTAEAQTWRGKEVKKGDLTVEEAFKLVMSAGLVVPDDEARTIQFPVPGAPSGLPEPEPQTPT